MTNLYNQGVKKNIEHLAKGKQLAFALLLCERMLPALENFSRDTSFNIAHYRAGLDAVWSHLGGDRIAYNYDEGARQCFDRAPDTEDFDHPLTSAALNSALSIAATLGFVVDADVNHVVEAAGLACETAGLYAEAMEATPPHSLGFDEVMRHPLVQRELRRQAEDLEFLSALPIDVSRSMKPLIKQQAAGTPALLPPEILR